MIHPNVLVFNFINFLLGCTCSKYKYLKIVVSSSDYMEYKIISY